MVNRLSVFHHPAFLNGQLNLAVLKVMLLSDDGHVVDPPIDLVEKTPTVQSEAVVESDTDSDFELDLS